MVEAGVAFLEWPFEFFRRFVLRTQEIRGWVIEMGTAGFGFTFLMKLSFKPTIDEFWLEPMNCEFGVDKWENGTGTEYLMVCSSCTTTFDTFRNDSFRRLVDPSADRTPNVFICSGCGRERRLGKRIHNTGIWIDIYFAPMIRWDDEECVDCVIAQVWVARRTKTSLHFIFPLQWIEGGPCNVNTARLTTRFRVICRCDVIRPDVELPFP